ncbi:hypothetical protein CGRA01v4_08954 [Colletotrichum graminicola]|nr:hypothetical protein CGRA01v4_08954 [Colletotrichum graminicola]
MQLRTSRIQPSPPRAPVCKPRTSKLRRRRCTSKSVTLCSSASSPHNRATPPHLCMGTACFEFVLGRLCRSLSSHSCLAPAASHPRLSRPLVRSSAATKPLDKNEALYQPGENSHPNRNKNAKQNRTSVTKTGCLCLL